jgi:hypothetical protein
MKSSRTSPSSRQSQTIPVPNDQVTGNSTPGYTTKDFWRDRAESEKAHNSADERTTEFERFADLTRKLVHTPKSEG